MNIHKMSDRDRFVLLFRECHELQRQIFGRPSNINFEYAIGVFTAQNLKAYTIWSICNPVPRQEIFDNNGVVQDFHSGNIILRAMYETILVSRFLLLDQEFKECRSVIVKVARLHGYREQHLLLTNMNSKLPEMENLKENLKKSKKEILEHEEFHRLPLYAQAYVNRDDIPNSKWYHKSREQLAKSAGFHKTVDLQYYKYFSNYTHSDPFAIQQISAIRHPSHSQDLTERLYQHAENFLSVSLALHLEVCKLEGMVLSLSNETEDLVKYWKKFNLLDLSLENFEDNFD